MADVQNCAIGATIGPPHETEMKKQPTELPQKFETKNVVEEFTLYILKDCAARTGGNLWPLIGQDCKRTPRLR
jgi:hypothetical protein